MRPNILQHPAMIILINLALFGLISQYMFSYQAAYLLPGNDGPMLLMLALDKMRYIGQSIDLHTNFLQGIGNLSFPMNPAVLPAFWFDPYTASGLFSPAAMFTFFAVMTFVTVLLVGWNHQFSLQQSLGAAWLLTILALPFFDKYIAVYPVSAQAPIFMLYLFCAALADIGIWRMGRGNIANTAGYALLLICSISILLVCSPAAIIIIAPFLIVSGIISLVAAQKRERIHKIIAAAIALLVMAVLGWIEYVAGLLLYTSSSVFFDELLASYLPSRQFGSILYQGRIADRGAGPFLFILGTFGAVAALYSREKKLTYAAIILLIGQFLHGFVGAELIKRSGGWSGPPPIYSEMIFYALYTLFAVSFISRILARTVDKKNFQHLGWTYTMPLLATLTLVGTTILNAPHVIRNLDADYAMPPASNEITYILEKEIALPPDSQFSGRVATIIPTNQAWQSYYASRLNTKLGNDLNSNGLWFKNIPTLLEYNQLISPRFYLLTKHFLSMEGPASKQNRSWSHFTKANPQMLRMLGVRFVLSTDAYIDGMEKRTYIAPEGLETLRLYELSDANVNGISANKVHMVSSLNEAIDFMKQESFDLHTAVIVNGPATKTPENLDALLPVTTSQIRVEQGAWHITAESAGRSLLMLPMELSHCTNITSHTNTTPELLPVNVGLTGVVFDKTLDISMVTRTGPFHHPRCRLKDYMEFKSTYRRNS